METTTEQQTSTPKKSRKKVHEPRTCMEVTCGKEFVPKNDRAKYCSPSCNAKAAKMRFAEKFSQQQSPMMGLGFTQQVPSNMAALYAIPPHAQMMIDHYKTTAQDWKEKHKTDVAKLEAKLETAQQKIQDLKEQIDQDENPKGALGFVRTNPEIIKEGIQMLGPFLAGLFSKGKSEASAPAQGIEAAPENLPDDVKQYVSLFAQWMAKLGEESRKNVWQLLTQLSATDEEKMNYAILSLLQQWH